LDVSGFTALTASEGDERAVAVLEVFRGALRRICSRRGVRIAKWLGDGAMLVAVEPLPLVSAALEMQHALDVSAEPIAVRCGITSGPVILLEGDDYIGHAVNLAARLCDLAGGGEILADPTIVPALPPWAMVEQHDEIVVRGVDVPVPIVRLCVAPAIADSSQDPVCGIPLTTSTAVAVRSAGGAGTCLFCSESCLDTWEHRPVSELPAEEDWVREGIV
jgi:class 3 adenylate cyclase/YHS domain-containing protein